MEKVKDFLNKLAANKDFLYIIQPFSVGDFLYVGGLSHAVQKRKNKKATVLIVQERMKNLGITYENLADIIYLPNNIMDALRGYFYSTGDYEGDNYIYGHFHTGEHGYIWDDTVHLINRYKKNVLKVPLDTKFITPIVYAISEQNIADLSQKYILDKSRTIIIAPYVHSTRQLPIEFWETLAQQLKSRGYIVYTNTDGFSEKPVAGTDAISPNFRELNFMADKIKCFIGSRSGIFDFLGLTETNLININPFPEWFWDLTLMYPDCNNRTLYNAIYYVEPIVTYLQKSKVNANVALSHPKINTKDIFYSYKDILSAILTDVEKF